MTKPALRRSAVAAALYLACFCLLTWPWVRHFGTAFLCDDGDGYQNVWNLWWVGTAVRSGHLPWFTPLLHAPGGTTLLGHTLNPFNGLLAMAGTAVGLPLVVDHNAIVAFAFTATGVTAYWLALDLTGSAIASWIGGFAFTFCGFHLEHAQGHLQLVSVEWLPLFLLAWTRLLRRPTATRGIATAVVLWLLLLCDYYYFFFAALTATGQLLWHVTRRGNRGWRLVRGLGPFLAISLATCGPIILPLMQLDLHGAHRPDQGSADLLGPFVPGSHWWARRLTQPYWSRLPGDANETSVYLGLSTIALAAVGAFASRRNGRAGWAVVGTGFFALSLGPGLQVCGRTLIGGYMPYAGLQRLFPPLALSGMPVRMMVMTSLATAMLAALGVAALLARGRAGRWVAAALVAGLFVDLWPSPLPVAPVAVPQWVIALRDLPGPGSIIDVTDTGTGQALYYQTVHHRPMASGYISRVPIDVMAADERIAAAVAARRWPAVRFEFGFRYLVVGPSPGPAGRGVVYDGPDRRIIDLDGLVH